MVTLIGILAGLLTGLAAPETWRAWVRGRLEAVIGAIPQSQPFRRGAPNKPIRWDRPASGLWKYKWAILVVVFFALGFGVLRGCDGGLFGKSRDALALEARLAEAEAELQAQLRERDARIAQIEQDAVVRRAQLETLRRQGAAELEAARPDNETPLDPDLVRIWRASLDRLREPASDAGSGH